MVDVKIDPNRVVVEGIAIPRPARIAPSQWLEFWEKLKDKNNDE
jgi:hypothetical protein